MNDNLYYINYFPFIAFVWILYGIYTRIQYDEKLKKSKLFIFSGLGFGLISNLLWVYITKRLEQNDTLKLALFWDSGLHITAFIIPLVFIKNKIKKENLFAMILIFSGISVVMY